MATDKNKVFQQINNFNNKPSNPNKQNSNPVCKEYYYVPEDIAKDRALFFGYLLKKIDFFSKIDFSKYTFLDIAFGSGNLTSHIVLDNIDSFKKIIFNDINIESNKDVLTEFTKGKAELSNLNFLNVSEWGKSQKADVVIFNPQIGGSYTKGDSKIEKQKSIIFDGSFDDYLKGIRVDTAKIKVKYSGHKILVHSDELSQSDLAAILKNIKIFNYHDVFYKSKQSKEKGTETHIVKVRATIDKVLNTDGFIVFYGDAENFNNLFSDFKTVFEYFPKSGPMLYIAYKSGEGSKKTYQKEGDSFIESYEFVDDSVSTKHSADIDSIESQIGEALTKLSDVKIIDNSIPSVDTHQEIKEKTMTQEFEKPKEPFKIDITPYGKPGLPYKNILLKGVPGTGKSRLINVSLLKKLGFDSITHPNILRINIHSASSNADLMQGIGISSPRGQVEYHEKQGLILHHLKEAISKPYQPFAIVLEEIQENSLNELIGDLIYLIEDEKRTNITKLIDEKLIDTTKEYKDIDEFFELLTSLKKKEIFYVKIPYLVATETKYRKLIVPDNLYFFCTSNYRDDKKIIEDNLLRRFDLIEMYPDYKGVIKEKDVATFLDKFNTSILKHFASKEIHPDRFIIGHANWINVKDESSFCRALLKAITEFKDIREIEIAEIQPVLNEIKSLPFSISLDILKGTYKEIIDRLQKKAFGDLLKNA
ncbi:MAG TPA: AAA family ATPase [Bacteroidales bacterium]|nr:AAA family ATPase [Bacteroidales bacterium]